MQIQNKCQTEISANIRFGIDFSTGIHDPLRMDSLNVCGYYDLLEIILLVMGRFCGSIVNSLKASAVLWVISSRQILACCHGKTKMQDEGEPCCHQAEI